MSDPQSIHEAIRLVVEKYTAVTNREARYEIYERSVFDFLGAGFTADDLELVLRWMMRENKRNKFQYCIQFGRLIGDHEKFCDLLGECRAKLRNTVKPATPNPGSRKGAAGGLRRKMSAEPLYESSPTPAPLEPKPPMWSDY